MAVVVDKRRIVFVLLTLSLGLAMLTIRLFSVQVLKSGKVDLTRASVLQRQEALVLDSGRGDFYDRSMVPMTGDTYEALLIFPVNRNDAALKDKWGALDRLLGTNRRSWDSFTFDLRVPQFWSGEATGVPKRLSAAQAAGIRQLGIPGLVVTTYRARYSPPYAAAQLLGFLSQDPERTKREFARQLEQGRMTETSLIGGSGLEKTFEPFLAGLGPTTLSLFTDSRHVPLAGLNLRETAPDNPYYPLKAVTTIDLAIQQQVEKMMDTVHVKDGAVVVLDAQTADIVAMVSRPSLDPGHVDPQGADWVNQALSAIVPGSVFKTVIAAAALDAGRVKLNETFHCDGELGKYGFSCWKPGGHGDLTFAEGFAESCNIVFAEVAKRLTAEDIERTARRLGLLQPVGWEGEAPGQPSFRQLDREAAGQLFAAGTAQTDEGVLIQTAIGQRDVRLTPLQAANMVVSIIHDGTVQAPRAVRELTYRTGRSFFAFAPHELIPEEEGISAITAKRLRSMMRLVVEQGTGTALGHAAWQLAGKSGTAQEGSSTKENLTQWFIGYGPYSAPRYAAAVVVQHTGPGQEGKATELFRKVMDALAKQQG